MRSPDGLWAWVDSYLRLWWQAERDRGRASFLGKAFDLFDFTVILLDPDGNLLFANERAHSLLDAGEGLRRAGQSITATDFDNAVLLQTAIQYFNHKDDDIDTADPGSQSVMLLRRADARPLVATISRIPQGYNGSAATILHVLDPDTETRTLVDALCRAFGLTATEACLAHHLVEGLTVEEAAREMRIQRQTARAYLKQIFSKTDTHRQADLVRVLLNSVVRIKARRPLNGGNGSASLGARRSPAWG